MSTCTENNLEMALMNLEKSIRKLESEQKKDPNTDKTLSSPEPKSPSSQCLSGVARGPGCKTPGVARGPGCKTPGVARGPGCKTPGATPRAGEYLCQYPKRTLKVGSTEGISQKPVRRKTIPNVVYKYRPPTPRPTRGIIIRNNTL
jgi:hypothetical protein